MARRLNLSTWNVLVVDDDPPSVSLIKEVFAHYKANVYAAESGIEALYQLKQMPSPTVILCDVWMPHMDGYVLLEKMRSLSSLSGVPIIAVTAQAMLGDQERILAAGFDGYISKPFQIDLFVPEIFMIVQTARADLRWDSV